MADIDRYTSHVSEEELAVETARFMSKVYLWMTGGLMVTAYVAMLVASSPQMLEIIFGNRGVFIGLIIAEFAAVLSLSFLLPRMNSFVAAATYFLYAALTGATLASIFIVYTKESIFQTFVVTACGFSGLSAFGYLTKKDLGPIGSFCMMGLFGMIGWGLLSLIFPGMLGGALSPAYSIMGLLVFAGLTAYDTQKIKAMNVPGSDGTDVGRKVAIHGALALYLDFINMFLYLLRLMGKRR